MTGRNRRRDQARRGARVEATAKASAELTLDEQIANAWECLREANAVRVKIGERNLLIEVQVSRSAGYFEQADILTGPSREVLLAKGEVAKMASFEEGSLDFAQVRTTFDLWVAQVLPVWREEFAAALSDEAGCWRLVLRLEHMKRLQTNFPDLEGGLSKIHDKMLEAISKISAAAADDEQKVTIQ